MERPQLSIFGHRDESSNSPAFHSPTFHSPIGFYKTTELRMKAATYIKPQFNNKRNIIDILKTSEIERTLGTGQRSIGQLIRLPDGKQYILRKTLVKNAKTRKDLLNELEIYRLLESDPLYINYISNLLYADVPLIFHESDAYNHAYFIFEYIDGITLKEFIESSPKLRYDVIMRLVTKIMMALKFIHSKGVIHRDIKPDNIFLIHDTLPVLFDFDSSCRVGIDCLATEFVGTRKYMSNSAKVLIQNNGFTTNSFNYTNTYDISSLVIIMEKDLMNIIVPEDKPKFIETIGQLKQEFKINSKTREEMIRTIRTNRTNRLKQSIRTNRLKQSNQLKQSKQSKGGACGCQSVAKLPTPIGGYRATARNLEYLKKWKRGESIGFTMRSSLKAKGLIPRKNGTRRVSEKYKKNRK